MELQIEKIEKLLLITSEYINCVSDEILELRPSEGKWSKKEILGHLVDSAIHNLVRFTEINYLEKPYCLRPYNQIDLVNLNKYQTINTNDLIQLWLSLNKQIIWVIKSLDEKALDYKVISSDHSIVNLRFLITDYVEHLEHHINQIKF